jgi:hypothetical protein
MSQFKLPFVLAFAFGFLGQQEQAPRVETRLVGKGKKVTLQWASCW